MTVHGSSLPPAERGPAVTRVRRAVARAIDRGGVLAPGERAVVACSGGPDSVALLDALARLAAPRRLRLEVAHVDHGLRGAAASARERETVAALSAARGLAFHPLRVTVPAGASPQNQARAVRHEALRRLCAGVGATALVLGHTADDQAETVLMRALSGATPRSLVAMGERDGAIARPLLRVWRRETIAYCAAVGLEALDDPGNADPRYLRTRVRHELIPALERVFPAARRRLVALADNQRQAGAPPHVSLT